MLRVLPQRWWFVLITIVIASFAGLIVAGSIGKNSSAAVQVSQQIDGALIGAALGVVLGLLLLLVWAPSDTRMFELRAQFPNAPIEQAVVDTQLASEFLSLAEADLELQRAPKLIALVFEASGVTAWIGSRPPQKIATIPWSEITSVGFGEFTKSKRKGAVPFHHFRIVIARGGKKLDLQFGLDRVPKFVGNDRYVGEADLKVLITRIEKLRTMGGPAA
jgi:hypothetical protein